MKFLSLLLLFGISGNTFAQSTELSQIAGTYTLVTASSDSACSYNYGWPILDSETLKVSVNGTDVETDTIVIQQRDTGQVPLEEKTEYTNINEKPIRTNPTRDKYGVSSQNIITTSWDGQTLSYSNETRSGFIFRTHQNTELKLIKVIGQNTLQYQGTLAWNPTSVICTFQKH
jgi:hypothetical protein